MPTIAKRPSTLEEQKQYGVGATIDAEIDAGDAEAYTKGGYSVSGDPKPVQPTPARTAQFNADGSPIQQSLALNVNAKPSIEVDKNKIREDLLAARQKQLDSINDVYTRLANDERGRQQEMGKDRLGRTRAVTSRSGTLGQDFGNAQLDETATKNAEAEKAAVGLIEAQKNKEIQALYGQVDTLVEEKAAAELTKKQGEVDSYVKGLTEKLSAIGAAGKTLQDIKMEAPEMFRKLLDQAGLDEFSANAIIQANNPKSQAKYERVGNKLVGYYVNPNTGKFETFSSENIPGLEESESASVEVYDGIPYVLKKDANGNLTGEMLSGFKKTEKEQSVTEKYGTGVVGEYNFYSEQEKAAGRTPLTFNEYQTQDVNRKAKTPKAPKAPNTEKEATDEMNQRLSSVAGPDGFISPDDFLTARDAWVQEGLSPTTFDTKFKGFKNPNNLNYVTDKTKKGRDL